MTNKPTNGSKHIEIWRQDNASQDLWHGDNNVMINTAALLEREAYFEVIRIPSANFIPLEELIANLSTQPQ